MARRAFALEDTNLQTATIATSRNRQYTDIDLTFTAKPTSGEIFKKTDAAAVKQAIKTLILTDFLEKPFAPDFGVNLGSQLFELAYGDIVSPYIKEQIISNIERYEPRAEVLNIDIAVLPDNNSIQVTLIFQVVNTQEIVEFTTTLSRLR